MMVERCNLINCSSKAAIISYAKMLQNGSIAASDDAKAQNLIISNECLVPANDFGDACIDGRLANEPLDFCKVAGGGYLTGLAAWAGVCGSQGEFEPAITQIAQKLRRSNIYCGAHTGGHAPDDGVGCGANDSFDKILQIANANLPIIVKNTVDLCKTLSIECNTQGLASAVQNWQNAAGLCGGNGKTRFWHLAQAINQQQKASGSFKQPAIQHLPGVHTEAYIVVNGVSGHTFSQRLFCNKLTQMQIAGLSAFALDVPRIAQICQALVCKNNQANAICAGIAFQLAVIAALTDGSLPVFVVKN